MDVLAADAVSNKINLRCLANALGQNIVKAVSQEFNRCSCTQIGAANAHNQKNVRITLDLGCRLLDPVKLVLVIIHRKVDPSQKIVARSGFTYQSFLRTHNCGLKIGHLFRRNESCCFGIIKCYFLSHNSRSPFLLLTGSCPVTIA